MDKKIGDDEFEDIIKQLERKGELKTNRGYKMAKVTKALIGTLSASVVSAFLFFASIPIYRYMATEELSASHEDMEEFYAENDIHTSFADGTTFSRLSVIDGKPVKFNVLIEITDEEKAELQKAIDDINAIFKVINPAYSFELNLNPSKLDEMDPYNVDIMYMTELDVKKNPKTLAQYVVSETKDTKNGRQAQNAEIRFRPGCVTRPNFTHEFFHHLGVGDAYLSELAKGIPSIMQSGEIHIREIDVAIIAGKYGDYTTEQKEKYLVDYIEQYESNQDWYKEKIAKTRAFIEELKLLNKDQPGEIDYNLAGRTIFAKSLLMSTYFQSSKIALISNDSIITSFLEIDSEISANNIWSCTKKYNQSSSQTFSVDGVICQIAGDQISAIYQQNNGIYEAYKIKDKWVNVKRYDICSQEEYARIMDTHILSQNKTDESISTEVLNQIKKAIGKESATNKLTFEEFVQNKYYVPNGMKVHYDKEQNCIILESGAGGSQNYIFTDGYIITDCNLVIYKNRNNEVEGAFLLNDENGGGFYIYKRFVFSKETENDNELER